MDAVNELQHLEAFLVDEHERDKKKIENFYECVQYAGAIVPRLWVILNNRQLYPLLDCADWELSNSWRSLGLDR